MERNFLICPTIAAALNVGLILGYRFFSAVWAKEVTCSIKIILVCDLFSPRCFVLMKTRRRMMLGNPLEPCRVRP